MSSLKIIAVSVGITVMAEAASFPGTSNLVATTSPLWLLNIFSMFIEFLMRLNMRERLRRKKTGSTRGNNSSLILELLYFCLQVAWK